MTPRIPPLAPADWPPAMGEAIAALAPANARHEPPVAKGRRSQRFIAIPFSATRSAARSAR